MSRWSRMVAPLAVALLAVVGGGAAASASSPDTNPPPGLPMYLALGDSIANGQQSAPLVKDYWTTVAGWRANGYVAQFRTDLVRDLNCLPARSDNARQGCRQLQLVNLARSGVPPMDGQPGKPGVTTQIVIDEQLPTATATLQARNHDANPRNDVEVVTIDVGGNDIFGPITSACLGESTAGCQAAVLGAFQAFAANYATILHELREAAGPDTVIITMTYYNPLPYCYIGANPAAGRSATGCSKAAPCRASEPSPRGSTTSSARSRSRTALGWPTPSASSAPATSSAVPTASTPTCPGTPRSRRS